jgi:hypothetical protein
MKTSPDAVVKNFAPDSDLLLITIGDWNINIGRDEDGRTQVVVIDTIEGSETSYILGEEGESQKV